MSADIIKTTTELQNKFVPFVEKQSAAANNNSINNQPLTIPVSISSPVTLEKYRYPKNRLAHRF